MALTLVQSASSLLPGQVAVQRFYTISDPAAGSDYTLTVPAGETWYLQGFKCTLNTSAAVATRFPLLHVKIGTNDVYYVPAASGIAAGAGDVIIWTPLAPAATVSNVLVAGSPDIPLQPGTTLSTSTQNLQAADQYVQGTLSILAYT